MGAVKQLSRALRNLIDSFVGIFRSKPKRRSRRDSEPEMVKVPTKWKKSQALEKKERVKVIEQQKMRIPGIRSLKRYLAAFLLFINFVFSQFLLGTVGAGAQPMFLIFLGNSLILVDYLWKTRQIREK